MNQPVPPQAKRHLGQILIDQGILTEDQLRIALLEQTKQHIPVGKLLVQLGFVSEATLRYPRSWDCSRWTSRASSSTRRR
jgi:hypothetical protein